MVRASRESFRPTRQEFVMRHRFAAWILVPLFAFASGQATQPAIRSTAAERRAVAARERSELFLNKPMVIKGTTLEGKEFSTEALKGKVVLIDFWASWCPDCAVETPRVIAAYKQFHEKGLEIVGISSDVTGDDLKEFLSKRKDIPWIQLYTKPAADRRHPLNAQYKVNWIPTTFLIDREGVCRSIEASDELEKLIPALLEEKAK
jgi:thiol-disulfide isomerase/thioredoxin